MSIVTELAEAMPKVREAHYRFCTRAEVGGHDFEVCPMWVFLKEEAERQSAHRRIRETFAGSVIEQ